MADQAKLVIVLKDEGAVGDGGLKPEDYGTPDPDDFIPIAPAGDIFTGVVEPPDDPGLGSVIDDTAVGHMSSFMDAVIDATEALEKLARAQAATNQQQQVPPGQTNQQQQTTTPGQQQQQQQQQPPQRQPNPLLDNPLAMILQQTRLGRRFQGLAQRASQFGQAMSQQVARQGGLANALGAAARGLVTAIGPVGLAAGAVALGFTLAAAAAVKFYRWMDQAAEQLARWSYELAAAQGVAEVYRIQAERRRAFALGDELATFTEAQARAGSVMSDITTTLVEPFVSVGAQIMDLVATILEILKPAIEFFIEWLMPIRMMAEIVAEMLKVLNKDLKAIRDWLLGAEDDEDLDLGLEQLRDFVRAASNVAESTVIPPAPQF